MSGGTFDISYYRLVSFSEHVEEWVKENEDNTPPLIRQRLLSLSKQAVQFAELARIADFYASGDYGDTSFNEEWNAITGD
jgi:hypothetical protein